MRVGPGPLPLVFSRRDQDIDMYRENKVKTQREAREVSEQTNPAYSLILDFQSPGLWEN